MTDLVTESLIEEFFERNFAELQADRGHALAPGVRETALQQAIFYWRRLGDLARRVTQTEVKLTLPGLVTPEGRMFAIEGIVDVVREEESVTLYDVKTHPVDAVHAARERYEGQLNVYAHVWQRLYGENLTGTAVICTPLPKPVRTAFAAGDATAMEIALAAWEPVVALAFSLSRVEDTIREFGEVVNAIESHRFFPRAPEDLDKREPGMRTRFAIDVCRNCDARYSCASFRTYSAGGQGGGDQFGPHFDDLGPDEEREEYTDAGLASAPGVADDLLP